MVLCQSRPALAAGLAVLSLVFLLPLGARAQGNQPATVPLATPFGSSGSASGGTLPSTGSGGSVPAPIIMIVDINRAIGESKAFKSIQSQLDTQRQSYQKEFSAKEAELEQEASDLQRDQRTLSPDQVEEKRHALVTRRESIQRDADGKQRAIQQGYNEAIEKVKQVLTEVMNGLALERHANLVLDRSAVPLFDKSYEVTTDALARLDQRLTSVQVTVPTVPAPASGAGEAAAPAKKK